MSKYSVNQYNVENILTWINTGEIAIPEIQRPFVWTASKVRDLMDSLYKGYPVGYIITWRNPDVRLKDGSTAFGKRVLIDGQQRITALTAAVSGQTVLNKNYQNIRIKIAYNPLAKDGESAFEVCNTAIERNPKWINDIAPLLNGSLSPRDARLAYLTANPEADENIVEEKINQLSAIKNRPIGIIELNSDLDINTVTEIFIRINQKGVVLSSADFVMSKIAADEQYGGNRLRKMIDYFCHLLNDSDFSQAVEKNDADFASSDDYRQIKWIAGKNEVLYRPDYVDVLRCAYTFAFKRGKFGDLVALLSGRDFKNRTNEESIAQESYQTLRYGLECFFKQSNYERFLTVVRSAGFVDKKLLNSQNSLNMAYAVYLHLKERNTGEHQIQQWVKKWLVMSLLTGRYSGSSETAIERDIQHIHEKGVAECLAQIELAELNEGFWTHKLVSQLDSSSPVNSAYLCYLAAQCKNNETVFLSDSVTVRDLLAARGDEHHLFPKNHLGSHGYKRSDYNQVANFVFTEQQTNIRLGDKPPAEYFAAAFADMKSGGKHYTSLSSEEAWQKNLTENCIPESWRDFHHENYSEFLIQRRKLMAEKIKAYYCAL